MDVDPSRLQQPPRRVLECLRVLAAVGNVPKTVRGLENVISQLTFTTRVVSPSAVLTELCRARPGGLQLSCARRWTIKGDASLKDKAEAVAREKAQHHNAIFFEASELRRSFKGAFERLYDCVSFSDVPQFTSKASLVEFVADRCSAVRELAPSQVLDLLKRTGAVSSGPEGQEDVVYITEGDALSLESLCTNVLLTGEATFSGNAIPSVATFAVWHKAVELSQEQPEVLILLHRFLQNLGYWGSDRPKTEAALAAELQPLCKVVIFYDPIEVLKKTKSRTKKKLFAVEDYTVTLSPSGFSMEGEEDGVDGLLSYLKLRLLKDLRRRGSSLVWGEDLEEEVVSAAVQRVEEWLRKKGVRVSREEGVESGEEEKMETAAVDREASSLMSLQQEFIDLCISQGRVEPSLVVQQLIGWGVVSVTEDGGVQYHQPGGSTLSAGDCVSQFIERERKKLLAPSTEPPSGGHISGKRRGKRFKGRVRKSHRLQI